MNRFRKYCVLGIAALILAGCATAEQVRRASDLIRTDNELTRLLIEEQKDNKDAVAYLSGLAVEAKNRADELGKSKATYADAISYYRIAATAYWRSGSTDQENKLFDATYAGQALCSALGNIAPDRDCLFLQLVLPFAGLEQHAADKDLANKLSRVHFNNNNATQEELDVMAEAGNALNVSRTLVTKILAMGNDERYLTHAGMSDYFCRNAAKAKQYHNGLINVYEARVDKYDGKYGDTKQKLGVTVKEAAEKRVQNELPSFCN